ncbi:MAG: TIGR00266 family protein [Sandaracinaceae bacterium]|nr:MAG: TIGR00266 family protein [Sandaracinaceae bacterium]HBQ12063.1 TIGR00266 family protein [Myxococcales bacterium]
MRYEMKDKPDFTMVKFTFDQPGEQVVVESAAMVARSSSMRMETNMRGGMLAAAKRKLMGGESLFQNTFTSSAPGETLYVAPAPEGDVEALELDGSTPIMMSSGAYLCSSPTVQLDTKWGGAKGFFSGTGMFLLKAEGTGPVFFSCYGGIHAVDVGPGGYICDTSHVVAFTGGLQYDVQKIGGIKSLFFSGEGLVCNFQGQGRLWISTRNPSSLASFIQPYRPVQRSN